MESGEVQHEEELTAQHQKSRSDAAFFIVISPGGKIPQSHQFHYGLRVSTSCLI